MERKLENIQNDFYTATKKRYANAGVIQILKYTGNTVQHK